MNNVSQLRLSSSLSLDDEVLQAVSHESVFAVLVVDFGFDKAIDGTYGHYAVDDLVKVCTQRIFSCLHTFRWFSSSCLNKVILIITSVDNEGDAELVAKSAAHSIVEAFSQPITLHASDLLMLPSIGLAIYPTDASNLKEIVSCANTASSYVRTRGCDDYSFFSSFMNESHIRKFNVEHLMQQALSRVEFFLNYQSQVDNSGRVVGVEALLRWNSPLLGNVSPNEFIPIAEENGSILSLGEWVIKTACIQRKLWHDSGLCDDSCYIAINVSPCQLRRSNFVEKMISIVNEVGIYPYQVDIEITEGILILDAQSIKKNLSELRAYGFHISVDDFGTGYSSFSYLKQFKVDTIKIDRSFVQDLGASDSDEAISSAIIGLAKTLGINTVAEGVETMAQVQFLKSLGCGAYQGYYFGEPMSAEGMTSLLRRNLNTPKIEKVHLVDI